MAARITLELDDRTAQGFADVVRNATSAEGATQELGQAMAGLVEADETIEGLKLRLGELEGKLGSVNKATAQTGKGGRAAFGVLIESMGIVSPQTEQTLRDFQGLGDSLDTLGGVGGRAFGTIAKAIPFVGLALGGASLAMQLFRDDTEDATKKVDEMSEAKRQLQAEVAQLRKEYSDMGRTREEALAARGFTKMVENLSTEKSIIKEMNSLRDKENALTDQLAGFDAARKEELEQQLEAAKALAAQLDSGQLVGGMGQFEALTEGIKHLQAEVEKLEGDEKALQDERTRAREQQQQLEDRLIELKESGRQTLLDGIEELGQTVADQQFMESAGLDEIINKRKTLAYQLQLEMDQLEELRQQRDPDLKRGEELLSRINELRSEHASLLNREKSLQSEASKVAEQAMREEQQLREKMAAEAEQLRKKEVAAAAKQFQSEVELLKQKLMEEQQLRAGATGGARSAFQQAASQVGHKDLINQIAAQRRESGLDTNSGGRQLNNKELFAQVRRELQAGKIGAQEIQQAQAEVVAASAENANHRGLVDRKTAEAFRELADGFAEQARQALELERSLAAVQKQISSTRDNARRNRR